MRRLITYFRSHHNAYEDMLGTTKLDFTGTAAARASRANGFKIRQVGSIFKLTYCRVRSLRDKPPAKSHRMGKYFWRVVVFRFTSWLAATI